jgi:hypothetical protein
MLLVRSLLSVKTIEPASGDPDLSNDADKKEDEDNHRNASNGNG